LGESKTTITVSVRTWKRIHDLQVYGETMDDAVARLLDYYEEDKEQ